MLTFGSLFAGIGGFDLGFERAGMVCKWQVEIDPYCQKVLAKHWPDVERYGDVRECGAYNLQTVDVICGGFPCQDVSVAGRREGLAGERSGLWFEFLRVIEEIKPEWVIVENVPGLLSSNEGRDMATIVGGLAECGYWWAYRIIDLQYFGVPQRRRRVFIVGSLTRGRAQQVLFERESSPWDTAPSRETGAELARDVAASLRNAGNGTRGWTGDNEQGLTIGTIPTTSPGGGWRIGSDEAAAGHLVVSSKEEPIEVNLPESDRQAMLSRLRKTLSNDPIAYGGNNTSGPIDVAAARNAHGSNRYDFESETFFVCYNWQSGGDVRLSFGLPNLQANQVPAVGVRRLTPTECERLQGFPDGHTDGQSDSARYRQLGNAVGVPKAEWLGYRLVEIDKNRQI